MTDFAPKRVAEVARFRVDYSARLGTGVTITNATWTVSVKRGTDANPAAMISGSATIAGPIVSQMLTGGVSGVAYYPICTATTSDGQTLILPEPYTGALEVV
jgi:hypothetical protein